MKRGGSHTAGRTAGSGMRAGPEPAGGWAGLAGGAPYPPAEPVAELRIDLLGGFRLRRNGELLSISPGEQRLLAFLAVHNHPLQRVFVAGSLWIDYSDEHAGGNLRTALWRLRHLDDRLIDPSRSHLALASGVAVDLHQASAHARHLLRHRTIRPSPDLSARLLADVLPDWYDDWVVIERERFRQVRLHALEALCAAFAAAGAYGLALEAGLTCVGAEPLRESSHRALIKVHLAEGNQGEAVRQYRLYRKLAMDELGLAPSVELRAFIEPLLVHNAAGLRSA